MFRPRLRTLAVAGVGAALAYLFDPENGPERRAKLSEQLRSFTEGAGGDATTPWADGAATPPSEVRNAATGGPALTDEAVAAATPVVTGANGT